MLDLEKQGFEFFVELLLLDLDLLRGLEGLYNLALFYLLDHVL